MGIVSSKQPSETKLKHARFGLVRIQNPHYSLSSCENSPDIDDRLMHVERSVECERIYSQWVRTLQGIRDNLTEQSLLLPSHYSFESIDLCHSGGVVHLNFPFFEIVLQAQIVNRGQLRQHFLQTEMWYLLLMMVRVGERFEYLGRKIGNVHPSNIVVNQIGQIKLVAACSLPSESDNYQLFLEKKNSLELPLFLAPQEINEKCIERGMYPSVDPCAAEVFSIGMTLLSAGTLVDCQSVYNLHPFQLRRNQLAILLHRFRQKYSEYLFQVVSGMLIFDAGQRMRCSEIYDQIRQHEQQILELKPFRRVAQKERIVGRKRKYSPLKNIIELPLPNQPAYFNPQNGQPKYCRTPINRQPTTE